MKKYLIRLNVRAFRALVGLCYANYGCGDGVLNPLFRLKHPLATAVTQQMRITAMWYRLVYFCTEAKTYNKSRDYKLGSCAVTLVAM